MIAPIKWLERSWTFDLPAAAFPAILERLRGTPARAADLVSGVPESVLGRRLDGWSIKEHIGHLDDLHALDEARLGEFAASVPVLSAADMGNERTEAAGHNARPVREILDQLRRHRASLVDRMDALSLDDVQATSQHPRLKRPVRLIDWAYFVAEHDDHHLVQARRVLNRSIER
jgi:hypothetical protein